VVDHGVSGEGGALSLVQDAQAFPGGGGGQPPTEVLGMLYLVDVFGEP
jgi:hypothetical protein